MPKQGDFSISDAKNEDGEWIMSPEQIRSEMAANLDPPDPDDFYDQWDEDEDE